MIERINAFQGHLDRYISGEIGLRPFVIGFFDLRRNLLDAESAEWHRIEPTAREEWDGIFTGLFQACQDIELPPLPGDDWSGPTDEEEKAFKGEIASIRSAMTGYVDRYGMSDHQPLPMGSPS